MQVKKQQLEPDMEQQTMQSTSCEMLGWIKHKLESRLLGENINNLRYADDTTLRAESK